MLWKKLILFSPGTNAANALILHACRLLDLPGKGFEAVNSDVSELWAISIHYLGNCSS